MIGFLEENLLLVLSIIGLVLGFLASISEFVTKRKPVRFLVIMAVLGLVVAVTYQIYDFNIKQEQARQKAAEEQFERTMQQARDAIIKEINLNVRTTKVTVEAIAARLETTKISEVATEMVTIRSSGAARFEETAAFAKGSPEMWAIYADWLDGMRRTEVAASLSVTFNANHHYNAGLLLAYLLTSHATRGYLNNVVSRRNKWETFNAEIPYLVNRNIPRGKVEWLLFYDMSNFNLVGFADAEEFIRELMVYHRLGKHREIEEILNNRQQESIVALQEKFSSVQTAVFDTNTPADLIQAMIQQQLAVSVAVAGPRPYVVHLERMIKLAASSG